MDEINNLINSSVNQDLTNYGVMFYRLLLAGILAHILAIYFMRFGRTFSSRSQLAKTLPILAMTVFAVIAVVKASLALSLGLVGALSIVRFRTPIKEPEELVFIFVAIAIGLGIGASHDLFTVMITAGIISAHWITTYLKGDFDQKYSTLSISFTAQGKKNGLNEIQEQIKKIIQNAKGIYNLKNVSYTQDECYLDYAAIIKSAEEAQMITEHLSTIEGIKNIRILDASRIPGV